MKIFLHEITDQETELDFTQEDPWVMQSVKKVDEDTEGEFQPSDLGKVRPIHAHLSLRKVDDVVVISGKVKTHIQLVCSRCANLFDYPCQPSFSALFCKDPAMAGVAHLQRDFSNDRTQVRPVGQNQGFARHAHSFEEDEDGLESSKDLDITYLSQDFIELGDVISEQLQLQVPFQPLCKKECKGMCSHCGTDLNLGKCACAKIKNTNPFSVLSDFKI